MHTVWKHILYALKSGDNISSDSAWLNSTYQYQTSLIVTNKTHNTNVQKSLPGNKKLVLITISLEVL